GQQSSWPPRGLRGPPPIESREGQWHEYPPQAGSTRRTIRPSTKDHRTAGLRRRWRGNTRVGGVTVCRDHTADPATHAGSLTPRAASPATHRGSRRLVTPEPVAPCRARRPVRGAEHDDRHRTPIAVLPVRRRCRTANARLQEPPWCSI